MKRWITFILITILGLGADLYTKFLAVKNLSPFQPFNIIGNYLQFWLVYNKGAIFGLDPRHLIPGLPLNIIFYILSAIAIVIIIAYFSKLKASDRLLCLGLSFILPGALGNLYDRVFFPARGVVDFIKMGFSSTVYWPIYNLADVYVTVGVSLILLSMLRDELARKKSEQVSVQVPQ